MTKMERHNEKPGVIGIAGPCRWLDCQEYFQVKGSPDFLPDGWHRLVVSKAIKAKNLLPADVDGWLCPKHYEELLSSLKKSIRE